MKVISMYLPQFHKVKENDEWWGEGFTEWVAAKNAKPLFRGHYQPHIPLNNNYYDLLSKDTMLWQTDLMKKYGIDGQCIYHYWFKDGRQILEKPMENLLEWKEVEMPFCICWANESWARTWSNIQNRTPWSSELEPERKEGDSGLLLEQKYGEEADWKKHFEYLLPFFKDSRYIRIQNKPVFMIYRISQIPCLAEMMHKWDEWAKKEGFDGIYLIGSNCFIKSEVIDLEMVFEPENEIRQADAIVQITDGVRRLKYDDIWNQLLRYECKGKNVTVQGFVGRDDTPRRGRNGCVVEGSAPDMFREYMAELIAKNAVNGCDITFVNAWNEWGEGMHLEPEKRYGYGYLEGILYAKENYKKYMDKYLCKIKEGNSNPEIQKLTNINNKYRQYWMILDRWLSLLEQDEHISDKLYNRNIKTVAIYGMGMLGKHLYYELIESDIAVEYAIDRTVDIDKYGINIYRPDQEWPKVDAIIVTATYAFDEIAATINRNGKFNVISLETILYEW